MPGVTTRAALRYALLTDGADGNALAQNLASDVDAVLLIFLAPGTFAARPAAGTAGRIYQTTDTDSWYFDQGATWRQMDIQQSGGGYPLGMGQIAQAILLFGTAAARPSPVSGNRYMYYWASDTNGGTPYQNQTGSAWQQLSRGLTYLTTDSDVAAANKDGAAGTYSMRTIGAGALQACAGNDARLSDTRVPTANSITAAMVQSNAITDVKLNNAYMGATGRGHHFESGAVSGVDPYSISFAQVFGSAPRVGGSVEAAGGFPAVATIGSGTVSTSGFTLQGAAWYSTGNPGVMYWWAEGT